MINGAAMTLHRFTCERACSSVAYVPSARPLGPISRSGSLNPPGPAYVFMRAAMLAQFCSARHVSPSPARDWERWVDDKGGNTL